MCLDCALFFQDFIGWVPLYVRCVNYIVFQVIGKIAWLIVLCIRELVTNKRDKLQETIKALL